MIRKINSRKGSTPTAILLLVFLTVALCLFTIVSLLMSEGRINEKTSDVYVLGDVYAKENLIKFYISKGVSLNEAVDYVKDSQTEVKIIGNKVRIEKKDISGIKEIIYEFSAK